MTDCDCDDKYTPLPEGLKQAFTGGFSELRNKKKGGLQEFTSYAEACKAMPPTEDASYVYATFLPDGTCYYVGKAAGRGGFRQRYAHGYGHWVDLALAGGARLFGVAVRNEDIDDAEGRFYDDLKPTRNRKVPGEGDATDRGRGTI